MSVSPIGWRAWLLMRGSDGRWQLASHHQDFRWDRENVAHCEHGQMGIEIACECGFNAWRSRELLEMSGSLEAAVIGSISLSGQVDGYELGWRASGARVESIELHPQAPDAEGDLRWRYGCTVMRREL